MTSLSLASSFVTNPCPLSTDNPDDALEFRAFYVNETFLQASLMRDVKGKKVSDGRVNLALTTPHLLTSKAEWRPQILADLEVRTSQRRLGSPWQRR